MKLSERSFNQRGQNDLSSGSNQFSQEQALVDIHAAMMEELGIGRKDTLPLQDIPDNCQKDVSTYTASLKPRKALPGAASWQGAFQDSPPQRNSNFLDAKFDDVNPDEAAIDSIADGQLARIRRQHHGNDYNMFKSQKNRANPTRSYGNSFGDEHFSTTDKTYGGRNKTRDRPLNINTASAEKFRNFNYRSHRLRSPHIYYNDARHYHDRHARVDLTIAHIRAAFEQPSSPIPSSSQSHGSNGPQNSRQAFGEVNNSVSHINTSHNSLRFPNENISHSADGSYKSPNSQPSNEKCLHEPSFSLSSTNNDFNEKRHVMPETLRKIPDSDSTKEATSMSVAESRTTDIPDSTRGQPQSPKSSPLLNSKTPQKAPERSSTLAIKRLGGLQDSKWSQDPNSDLESNTQMSEISGRLSVNQYVMRELPVKFQKDKELRQLGIVKLVRERGTDNVEIHLEQNHQIFLREIIGENSIFASDWKNPEYVIVFKAVQKMETYPTWRIYFKMPYLKDEFERAVNDLRKKKNSANSNQIDLTSPVSVEYPSSRVSLLDNSGNRSPSKYDLIHIDPSSKAYLTTPASNNRINTDTLNEMSEIGGITPLINFSETTNNEKSHPRVGSFTQDLIDINDDLLIEGLCEKLLENRSGTVLDLLSELVVRKDGPSASSMKPEEIRNSPLYAQELNKIVEQVLKQSEVFTQLPSVIADSYMIDKARKILEKSLSRSEGTYSRSQNQSPNFKKTSAQTAITPSEISFDNCDSQPHRLQEWSQQSDFYKVPSTTLFSMSNSLDFMVSTLKNSESNTNSKRNKDLATRAESPINAFTADLLDFPSSDLSRITYSREELLCLKSCASYFEEERLDDEVALYIGPKRVIQAGRPVKPKSDTKIRYNNERRTTQHQAYHAHHFNRQKWENHQEKAKVFDVSSGDFLPISPPPQELTMEMKSSTTNSDLESLIKNMEGMKLDTEILTKGEINKEFLPTPPATAKFQISDTEANNYHQNLNSFESMNSESFSNSFPWADQPAFSTESNNSLVDEKYVKDEKSRSATLPPKMPKNTGTGTQKGLKSSMWCSGTSDTVSGYN